MIPVDRAGSVTEWEKLTSVHAQKSGDTSIQPSSPTNKPSKNFSVLLIQATSKLFYLIYYLELYRTEVIKTGLKSPRGSDADN